MRHRSAPPARIGRIDLIRYILLISMLGTFATVLLDELAAAAEASHITRRLVVLGSAAAVALGGVVLYDKFIKRSRNRSAE